jgi:N-acetylglucosaminyl-diphospho-decaprenol L-rhamnosyltransferase
VRQTGGMVLFQPKAEVIHIGHTSHASPLRVEFHKGVGLARYFSKRAGKHRGRKLAAWLLAPLVVGAALARPLVWRAKK